LILASILGQEFHLDVLVAASGRPEAAVLSDLDAAVQARLLDERQPDGGERYGFVHALIQEALYEQLPVHRRRKLHLRAGEALEEFRAQPATAAAELTRHFLRAGDTIRAKNYALQAGDHAVGRYAHAEAAQHYKLALELLRAQGNVVMAAEVQRRLAGELQDLNRLPDAVAAYEAALAAFNNSVTTPGKHRRTGGLADSMIPVTTSIPPCATWMRRCGSGRLRTNIPERQACWRTPHGRKRWAETRMGPFNLPSAASHWRSDSKIQACLPALWSEWSRATIGALDESLADCRRSIEAAERSAETQRLAFAHQSHASDCLILGAWDEGRAAARAGLAARARPGLGSGSAEWSTRTPWAQAGGAAESARATGGSVDCSGPTDHQIADRLTITEGTAGVHVSHILNKLGFHARTEIASWAVRHGLGGATSRGTSSDA
jgi:hypothetical protein